MPRLIDSASFRREYRLAKSGSEGGIGRTFSVLLNRRSLSPFGRVAIQPHSPRAKGLLTSRHSGRKRTRAGLLLHLPVLLPPYIWGINPSCIIRPAGVRVAVELHDLPALDAREVRDLADDTPAGRWDFQLVFPITCTRMNGEWSDGQADGGGAFG